MSYPVLTVPNDASESLEQVGTKFKFWFDGDQRMFKEGRPNTGEHWSEKACCEIARLLDLPHAQYDLAIWRGRIGVVTQTFVPQDARLVLGNEVLAKEIPDYPQDAKRFETREHRVTRVLALLRTPEVQQPLGFASRPSVMRACDVFVGYLLLDGLVSNQDRHHENWGYVVMPDATVHLAPTFDHASSLGRNESDAMRKDRLTTRDSGRTVERYVERAQSAFYETAEAKHPLSPVAAFEEAAKYLGPAARCWQEKLAGCSRKDFEKVFNDMPPGVMTPLAAEFAVSMILINQRRLLQVA